MDETGNIINFVRKWLWYEKGENNFCISVKKFINDKKEYLS